MPERNITRIWRHADENRAVVEYDEIDDQHIVGRKAADHTLPPTQGFHDAMDALAPHIAAPYGLASDQHRTIKPREVRLTRQEGDDGLEKLLVNLYGTRSPEGFDANVSLRIPRQEVVGTLKKVIDKLVVAANDYADGKRGQITLSL